MTSLRRKHPDIDGGWAYVILLASFLSLMLVCGALYSVSVFNVIFLDVFKASKTSTSLIGSALIGLIAFMGPVSSAMSNRYGWRLTMMVGGVIATLGTFLSSFAQNMTQLVISYGLISGIGHGLCYTPAIVVVGYYFEVYRTLASGLASVGAGVGMMVFPPLIRYLRAQCSWRELFVYMSCLYAQVCVLGALMRPLPKRREDMMIPDVEVDEIGMKSSAPESSPELKDVYCKSNNNSIYLQDDKNGFEQKNGHYDANCNNERQDSRNVYIETNSAKNGENVNGIQDKMHTEDTNHDSISLCSSLDGNTCHCTKIGLYFGTCCQYSCSKSVRKPKRSKSRKEQLSLLSGSFAIFCLSIFMFGVGLSALYVHLSAFAISHGASETESSFIITILGISSIVSRIITGIAGNDPTIDNTILYIGAFGIAGICTMICPLIAYSYNGRLLFTVCFGFYGSCFNVLLAPLTVEIIGLNQLSTAFGIEMVVNGVAYFLGPPLAGVLYDMTDSYDTSFFLAGSCLMLSAIVMMFVSVGGSRKTTNKSIQAESCQAHMLDTEELHSSGLSALT